jgi:hypothetical protein
MIVISPQKFTEFFSMAVIALIVGLAFLNGPRSYLKKLTAKKSMIATSVLFGSMILSLYFSLIEGSYLYSLIFCVIEFNAVILFFCNSFPIGTQGVKFIGSSVGKVLTTPFRN